MGWPIPHARDVDTLRRRLNLLYEAGAFAPASTDALPEGVNNLYHTDARAVAAIKSDPDWKAGDWDAAYGWGDHSTVGYLLKSGGTMTGQLEMGQNVFSLGDVSLQGLPFSLFGAFNGSTSSDPFAVNYGETLLVKCRATNSAAGAGSALVQIGNGTMTILASADMTNTSSPATGKYGITYASGEITVHTSSTSFVQIATVLKFL